MKLKNCFILFMAVTSISLLQGTYTCTAMKPNSSLSITQKKKEKEPKKNEHEKFKRDTCKNIVALNPDNKQVPTKAKLGRYGKRCRCQKCYWTGYPPKHKSGSYFQYVCGGCYSGGIINGEVLTHWFDDKIPGIELSLDFGKCLGKDNCPHNGFIFDTRLSWKNKINRIKLAEIKKTDEKYWFYCYSCKKHFPVPMNAIQHPPCVFEY